MAMDGSGRRSERYDVYLYVEQVETKKAEVHVMNLSATGFLVRGAVAAGIGGVFHASFRVRPASGEMRVTTHGKVVRSHRMGLVSEYGIEIQAFGCPAEEEAYQSYVRELAERSDPGKKPL
jgi:hypothetical protein